MDPAQSIGRSSQLQDLLLSLPYFCIALISTVCPSVLTLNLFIPGDGGSTGWGWSGGAMVLGKLPVPGRPTILITVGQGPTVLAVGAGGGCLDIFTLVYHFSPLSPSLWETARCRLKYCLKGPLNPKQPTNQPTQRVNRAAIQLYEYIFCVSLTLVIRRSTPLKCSLVGLQGGWGARRTKIFHAIMGLNKRKKTP